MKKLLILFLIPLLVTSCTGQIDEKTKNETGKPKDESIQPKTDIRVNKEYDEDGNLIRYDSTYVWSYSNVQGDSMVVDIDSVMSKFYPFLDSRQHFYFPRFGDDMFYDDSLFYHNFLNQDYFKKRWEDSRERMNKMMDEMDSIKSEFFKEFYPDLNKENF